MLELKLDEVTKKYKDNIAVNHISAAFTHGVYGLLGANGAGKNHAPQTAVRYIKAG